MILGFVRLWLYIKNPELPKNIAKQIVGSMRSSQQMVFCDCLIYLCPPCESHWSLPLETGDGRMSMVLDQTVSPSDTGLTARAVKLQTGFLYHYACNVDWRGGTRHLDHARGLALIWLTGRSYH